MKKASVVLLFLCIFTCIHPQKYDLIVSDKGDSIACRIDSISDAAVYLEMKSSGRWVHTYYRKNEVIEYKYDAIDKRMVLFKPKTSIIDIVCDENDPEQLRAFSHRNIGRSVMIVTGCVIIPTVIASCLILNDLANSELGWFNPSSLVKGFLLAIGAAELSAMMLGIIVNQTGIKELERIRSRKNNAFNGVALDLKPSVQYNPMTQNYQPGVTLRIRF